MRKYWRCGDAVVTVRSGKVKGLAGGHCAYCKNLRVCAKENFPSANTNIFFVYLHLNQGPGLVPQKNGERPRTVQYLYDPQRPRRP